MSHPPRSVPVVLAILVAMTAPPAPAQERAIGHDPVACVLDDRFPRLDARLPTEVEVGRARVHFRPEAGQHWYSVAMTAQEKALSGVLPRPRKSMGAFRYYIEVTDTAFGVLRTPEQLVQVVGLPGECQSGRVASTVTSASVVVSSPPGAPPVPAGFAATGVTAGAAATGVAAGAAAGGGIGAGTILLVGGGVAAAGAVAATAAGGGGDEDAVDPPPMAPPRTIYNVRFVPPQPGLDVSVCLGRPLSWSSQNISVLSDGSFDMTWAPMDPNTLRVTGRLTTTDVTATLTCVSGGPSGSLSATGSGGTYNGSFDFRGSRGGVTIVRE